MLRQKGRASRRTTTATATVKPPPPPAAGDRAAAAGASPPPSAPAAARGGMRASFLDPPVLVSPFEWRGDAVEISEGADLGGDGGGGARSFGARKVSAAGAAPAPPLPPGSSRWSAADRALWMKSFAGAVPPPCASEPLAEDGEGAAPPLQQQQAAGGPLMEEDEPQPPAVPRPPSPPPPPPEAPRALILYGSQLGTGEEIARRLQSEAAARGVAADVRSMAEARWGDLGAARTPVVVAVASSTGDGEPPDNAAYFSRQLRKAAAAAAAAASSTAALGGGGGGAGDDGAAGAALKFAGVRVALLGLGDSSYARFMAAPRAVRALLLELGAAEFYAAGEADAAAVGGGAEGQEAVVEAWCEGLWAPLRAALAAAAEERAAAHAAVVAEAERQQREWDEAQQPQQEEQPEELEREAEQQSQEAQPAGETQQQEQEHQEQDEHDQQPAAAAEEDAEEQQPSDSAATGVAAAALGGDGSAPAADDAAADSPHSEPQQEEEEEEEDQQQPEKPAAADGADEQREAAPAAADEAVAELLDELVGEAAVEQPPLAEDEAAAAVPEVLDDSGRSSEQRAEPGAAAPAPAEPEAPAQPEPPREPEGIPPLAPPRAVLDFAVPPAAAQRVREAEAALPSAEQRDYRDPAGYYSAEEPFWARVAAARPLAAPGGGAAAAPRAVAHCELDVEGSGLRWAPGDAVGVVPENDPAVVAALLQRLGADGDAVFTVRAPGAPAAAAGGAGGGDAAGGGSADAAGVAAGGSNGSGSSSTTPTRALPARISSSLAGSIMRGASAHSEDPAGGAAGGAGRGGVGGAGQQQQADAAAHPLPHIPSPCSLRHAFARCVDISGLPSRPLLRLLAEHCANDADKKQLLLLSSRTGREAFARDVAAAGLALLDLLERFPSCVPPPAALLDALPPLAPRLFSVSCDAAGGSSGGGGDGGSGGGPRRLEFAVAASARATGAAGVASGWLLRALAPWLEAAGGRDGAAAERQQPKAEVWVPIFLRPAANFSLPRDPAVPVVLIAAPGPASAAPFRAFVQRRAAELRAAGGGGAVDDPPASPPHSARGGGPRDEARPLSRRAGVGEVFVYAGCGGSGGSEGQQAEDGLIYAADFEAARAAGAVAKLAVARPQPPADADGGSSGMAASGGGVAELLRADATALAALVSRRAARVCVCCETAAAARGVQSALVAALASVGALGEAGAEAELRAMAQRGLYAREVWGA